MTQILRAAVVTAVAAGLAFLLAPAPAVQASMGVCPIAYTTTGASPGNISVTITWDGTAIYDPVWDRFQRHYAAYSGVRIEVIPRIGPYVVQYGTQGYSGSTTFETPGGEPSIAFIVSLYLGNSRWSGLCTANLYNVPDSKAGISSITPNIGAEAGGYLASIRGANLAGATSITIGGVVASVQSVTDAEVVVKVPQRGSAPAGTPLDVVVVAPKGTATLASGFTYQVNPPSLREVTPACGLSGGEKLKVVGNRLSRATAVTIGGIGAPFTLVGADMAATLSVVAPVGLTGPQPVVVSSPDGSSGGLVSVLYGPCSAAVPGPTIESVTTVAAGGLATVNWSLPNAATNPGTSNVLGVEYAAKDGKSAALGPWTPVGGTFSGFSGSFTIAGFTQQVGTVLLRSRSKVAGDPPSIPVSAKFDFGTTPTPATPGTGNAGSVPGAGLASSAAPSAVASSSGGTSSGGSSAGAGAKPSAAVRAAIDAPCTAAAGTLYPPMYATLGSQLTVVPRDIDKELLTKAAIAEGALPPGLALDGAFGIINGVPTRAGVYSATITGRLSSGTTSEKVTITVNHDPQTLQYAVANVAVVDESFSVAPTTNAPADATYEVVCGTVPPGVRFDKATGRISGTPSKPYLEIAPLRVVERSKEGFAVASMIVAVVPQGQPSVHYPGHPQARVAKRLIIRPAVVGANNVLYYNVVRGKLPRGLAINHQTGVITGKARKASRPHVITVAAYAKDGSLVLANPMKISIRRHP